MATYLTSNIFSDIYVGGNCVVKGTMTVSGGGGVTQWTTSGTNIYYTTGNVGIGTATAPGYPLDVYGAGRFLGLAGAGTWSLAATTGSGTNGRVADVSFYSTFTSFPGDVGQRRTADITAGFSTSTWGTEYMAFGVGNGGGSNDAQTVTLEKMRITSVGNVGIMTNAPGYPLHVVGDINFTGSLRQNGTVYAPSSQWTGTATNPIYYVPFVGIGSTLTPTANLMVTGNVFVSNAIQTTNIVAAGFTSNATTTTFTCDTLSMPFVNATQVTVASSVGIGTTLPTSALHVIGQITGNFPVHLSMYGGPSYYNSSGVLVNPTIATGQYYYLLWPSSGLTSQNWIPSYTNTTRLTIPYNGIYSVKFTFQSGAATSPTYEIFISKNLNNGGDLNPADDKLLASAAIVTSHTTISATAYLLTSDFINFGTYIGSGSGFSGTTAGTRCTANVTLIQRIS
jgi:hypothetical protein